MKKIKVTGQRTVSFLENQQEDTCGGWVCKGTKSGGMAKGGRIIYPASKVTTYGNFRSRRRGKHNQHFH